jgi:hypothetical protein
MERMSPLAVGDKVTIRVSHYSFRVWVDVPLAPHPLVLAASGLSRCALLQEREVGGYLAFERECLLIPIVEGMQFRR